MTWGAMVWKIVSDPIAIMFALIVGGLCGLGGYFYGQHVEHVSNEAEKQTAIVQQFEAVRPKEAEAATNVNKASKDHETTKASNKTNAAVISSNFTGLRVRAACNDKPTIAASSGEPANSAESERPRTGEADFDGITRKVIELGNDYDDAVSQIAELNSTLDAYRKACNAE
jgi:hypothetical protein